MLLLIAFVWHPSHGYAQHVHVAMRKRNVSFRGPLGVLFCYAPDYMLTFEKKKVQSSPLLNITNSMSKKVEKKVKISLCRFKNNKIKSRKSAGLTISFIKNTC